MKMVKKLGVRAAAMTLGAAMLLPSVTAFAATSYTATDTDTFWTLSKKFDVPLQKLQDFNPTVKATNIYAGLKLTIPAPTTSSKLTAASVTTASGNPLAYSKVVSMTATGYSAAIEENAWGAVDYFGNPLKLGTIAVDPSVIPLGTKVYITGYSFDNLPAGGMVAYATDAGSAIKGNRIDIFIPGSRSEVSNFGFQNVKLYVLK